MVDGHDRATAGAFSLSKGRLHDVAQSEFLVQRDECVRVFFVPLILHAINHGSYP